MLQRTVAPRIETYLARRDAFNRRRRKIRLDFDALHGLFANGLSSAEIARRAGVSRPRMDRVFDDYFGDLFGTSGLQRRRTREQEARVKTLRGLAQAIAKDRLLNALRQSAARARRRRTIEPIVLTRRGEPRKRFRHRAVLVDGRDVEPAHHIRNRKLCPSGGTTYAVTSVTRRELRQSAWTIFYLDVRHHPRRVIRCRNVDLLQALFPPEVARKNVYIPLDRRPSLPRYDFLADEDNWS